jgi:hypothetical protein
MSPPYFTAHDYVRSVRLEMLALGICSVKYLREIRAKTIGSVGTYGDHASSLGLQTCDSIIEDVSQRQEKRASILCHYLLQMKDVLTECKRVLQPEGKLVIVIGDSTSQGLTIPTAKLVTELCTSVGMQLDSIPVVNEIRSRGFMTRRNVTASVIEDEWILRFANS